MICSVNVVVVRSPKSRSAAVLLDQDSVSSISSGPITIDSLRLIAPTH